MVKTPAFMRSALWVFSKREVPVRVGSGARGAYGFDVEVDAREVGVQEDDGPE